MTWCGEHPEVLHLAHNYDDEADVTNAEMKRINERLQRSKTLPKIRYHHQTNQSPR